MLLASSLSPASIRESTKASWMLRIPLIAIKTNGPILEGLHGRVGVIRLLKEEMVIKVHTKLVSASAVLQYSFNYRWKRFNLHCNKGLLNRSHNTHPFNHTEKVGWTKSPTL